MTTYFAITLVCLLLAALIVWAPRAAVDRRGHCPNVRAQIVQERVQTWRLQRVLEVRRSRVSAVRPASCAYAKWVRELWAHRHHRLARVDHGHLVVAARLNRGLAGTPMSGTGRELEQAGRRHHIHPALIAAIAGTESSFGAAMCGNYNAYGLGNCTGIWNVPAFRSWGESYRFMARFLSERWPGATTPWSFAGYAACDSCWGNRVAFFMRRLGFGYGVRYR